MNDDPKTIAPAWGRRALVLAFCFQCSAFSQPIAVQFSTRDFTGMAAARRITITPSGETLLQTDGTNLITGGPLALPIAPGGGGATTNLWPGKYTVTLEGIPKSWRITVTTNYGLGPVPAVWFAADLVTYVGTNAAIGVTEILPGSSNVHLSPSFGTGIVTLSVDEPGAITHATTADTANAVSGSVSNTFDLAGAGAAAASDATNGLTSWLLQSKIGPSVYDLYGAAAAAAQDATNGLTQSLGSPSGGNASAVIAGTNGIRVDTNGAAFTVSVSGAVAQAAHATNADTATYAASAGSASSASTATYAASAATAASVPWSALPAPVLTNAAAFDAASAARNATNPLPALINAGISNYSFPTYFSAFDLPVLGWFNNGPGVLGNLSYHPSTGILGAAGGFTGVALTGTNSLGTNTLSGDGLHDMAGTSRLTLLSWLSQLNDPNGRELIGSGAGLTSMVIGDGLPITFGSPVASVTATGVFYGSFSGVGVGLSNFNGSTIQAGTVNSNAFDAPTKSLVSNSGSAVTNNLPWIPSPSILLASAAAGAYQVLVMNYNANLTPTNATVLWPDGTYGVWTATNLNATWLTADGYTLTYTNTGKLIAQPTVLRDQNGNITNSPALLIAP